MIDLGGDFVKKAKENTSQIKSFENLCRRKGNLWSSGDQKIPLKCGFDNMFEYVYIGIRRERESVCACVCMLCCV